MWREAEEDIQLEGMSRGKGRAVCPSGLDYRVHWGRPCELSLQSQTGPVGAGLAAWL